MGLMALNVTARLPLNGPRGQEPQRTEVLAVEMTAPSPYQNDALRFAGGTLPLFRLFDPCLTTPTAVVSFILSMQPLDLAPCISAPETETGRRYRPS